MTQLFSLFKKMHYYTTEKLKKLKFFFFYTGNEKDIDCQTCMLFILVFFPLLNHSGTS